MFAGAVAAGAGVALGLSLAAPPGPMNAVIAEESATRGWPAGFAAGLGAMTADATFFALALAGVVTVVRSAPALQRVMVFAGGLLMFYVAYGALDGAAAFAGETDGAEGDAGDAAAGFLKAFALAITNPYQVTWWLTAGVALLSPGDVEAFGHVVARTGGPLTVVGFFAGILLWVVAFPAAIAAAGHRVDRFARAVASASAVVLVLFGLAFCWRALVGV
ncbi:MAG: LysE family transporter [Halobacteriaceae archaeon]